MQITEQQIMDMVAARVGEQVDAQAIAAHTAKAVNDRVGVTALSTQQIADMWDLAPDTVRGLMRGAKVPRVVMSPKIHRYRIADLEEFLGRRTVL